MSFELSVISSQNQISDPQMKATLFCSLSKRFSIYQFMLTHMSDEDRFNLTGKLCQEVCYD